MDGTSLTANMEMQIYTRREMRVNGFKTLWWDEISHGIGASDRTCVCVCVQEPVRTWRTPWLLSNSEYRPHLTILLSDWSGLTHSLPAPRSAVDLGTDMLELDCHLTKDEQVVVSHDPNLRRVCGMNANISELAYAVSSYTL